MSQIVRGGTFFVRATSLTWTLISKPGSADKEERPYEGVKEKAIVCFSVDTWPWRQKETTMAYISKNNYNWGLFHKCTYNMHTCAFINNFNKSHKDGVMANKMHQKKSPALQSKDFLLVSDLSFFSFFLVFLLISLWHEHTNTTGRTVFKHWLPLAPKQ